MRQEQFPISSPKEHKALLRKLSNFTAHNSMSGYLLLLDKTGNGFETCFLRLESGNGVVLRMAGILKGRCLEWGKEFQEQNKTEEKAGSNVATTGNSPSGVVAPDVATQPPTQEGSAK